MTHYVLGCHWTKDGGRYGTTTTTDPPCGYHWNGVTYKEDTDTDTESTFTRTSWVPDTYTGTNPCLMPRAYTRMLRWEPIIDVPAIHWR